MKHYLKFTAADFAQDADFLKWVKYPERYPHVEKSWLEWLEENPHKKEEIEEARLMIMAVVTERQMHPDDSVQEDVWSRIQDSILLTVPETQETPLWQRWYSLAAMVVLLIGTGWFTLRNTEKNTSLAENHVPSSIPLEKQINNADVPKTIVLSDETSIVLQPHSSLEYPQTFTQDLREVFLTGEAFFEVQKDPKRPFLVHTHEIVTRVLGTSFTVRSMDGGENVLVQVKTGKVSVFKGKEDNSQTPDESVEGVVLMANQQVIYERNEMKMTKSLIENPNLLIPIVKREFEFVDTPVKEVFAAIEEAYGVEIVYDEEVLANCYLNASLDDVPLYDKLKLICKGINTTYQIMDSHIIIYGKGCDNQ